MKIKWTSHSERAAMQSIKDGQDYAATPVYVRIRREVHPPLAAAVGECFPETFLACYELVKLRWMKPDGNGGLTPR